MLPFVERLAKISTKPVIVKPNAGMPKIVDGRTVFTVGPGDFAALAERLVHAGASIVGGCCGTTPAHIAAVRESRTKRNNAVGSGGHCADALAAGLRG